MVRHRGGSGSPPGGGDRQHLDGVVNDSSVGQPNAGGEEPTNQAASSS
jgi:hypothetical protein